MQKQTFGWPQALGVIVIAGLMFAGAYIAIQISPSLPNTFDRLAAAFISLTQKFIPGEHIIMSVNPQRVESGDQTILSWTHRNKSGNGVYTLTYPCTGGSYLGVRLSTGNKKILCDTPSEVVSADSNLTLIPVSEAGGVTEVRITLSYSASNENASPITASTTLSIVGTTQATKEIVSENNTTPVVIPSEQIKQSATPNASKTPTAGTRTEKTYTLASTSQSVVPKTPAPYGKTDLAPRIIAVGTIDRTTNQFTATTSLHVSDRIAVKFEVENLGTADSGSWTFSAVLPTFPMYIFQSEGQQNLQPGDRIEFTLGFDQVEPDINGRFVVNVDPTSSIPEASESNNIATTTIRASSK